MYFGLDIGVNFRSAYYSRRGNLVTNNKNIVKKYLSTWFVLDLMAVLPIQYVEYWISEGSANKSMESSHNRNFKVAKAARLIRLASKITRLYRLKRALVRYEDYLSEDMAGYFFVFKMLLVLIFVVHLMACAWFAVGTLSKDTLFHQASGLSTQPGASRDNSGVAKGWVLGAEFTDQATLSSMYLRSLFYCVTDFAVEVANTDWELLYVCFQHTIYEGFFAFSTGAFASSIINGRISETRRSEKMAEIREFLHKNKIPVDVRQKITTYYEHYFTKKSVFDDRKLLQDFPPNIRATVIDLMYRDMIANMPFFRDVLTHDLSFQLCMALKPVVMQIGEVVHLQGTQGHELYVIQTGQCEVFTKQNFSEHVQPEVHRDGTHTKSRCCSRNRDQADSEQRDFGVSLGVLTTGAFFAENAVIEDGYVHERTVVVKLNAQLGYISKDDVDKLATSLPELKTKLKAFSKTRTSYEKRKIAELRQRSRNKTLHTANLGTEAARVDRTRTAKYAVWVGHVSESNLTEKLIKDLCVKFGIVESVHTRVKSSDQHGASRGWALVVYKSEINRNFAIESCAPPNMAYVGDELVRVEKADEARLGDLPVLKLQRADLDLLDQIKKLTNRLNSSGIEQLKQSATRRYFVRGTLICEAQQMGSTMFIVLQGEVQVSDDKLKPRTLGRGKYFGEESLLMSDQPLLETTQVLSDTLTCMCIELESFKSAYRHHGITTFRDEHARVDTSGSESENDSDNDSDRGAELGQTRQPGVLGLAFMSTLKRKARHTKRDMRTQRSAVQHYQLQTQASSDLSKDMADMRSELTRLIQQQGQELKRQGEQIAQLLSNHVLTRASE